MTHLPQTYTLYFYNLNTRENVNLPQTEAALHNFFTTHAGKKNPTPNVPVGRHDIQIQDIVEFKSMGCSLVSGVVKKFRESDLPKKGIAGEASEKEIELDDNEFLVDRTYFIYNLSNNVLLYQSNPQGISCKHFKKYLITQRNAFPDLYYVSFNFIPVYEAYEMLKKGTIPVKKLKIHIPRPTTMDLFSRVENPSLLDMLKIMNDFGGDLDLTLNESNNKSLINPSITEFLHAFREMLNNGPKIAGIKGKIEVINEDDTIYPIDLLMDKLSATVTIPMSSRYPKADDIIKAMKNAFSEKQDVLNMLYKGGK